MTKVCTAYTVCRIMDEMGINHIEKTKSIFLRVSKNAAYINGTSAYLQWDNRISIFDCFHAMLLPSGNDAAIVLATEFGRWLFLICDKNKGQKIKHPTVT